MYKVSCKLSLFGYPINVTFYTKYVKIWGINLCKKKIILFKNMKIILLFSMKKEKLFSVVIVW